MVINKLKRPKNLLIIQSGYETGELLLFEVAVK